MQKSEKRTPLCPLKATINKAKRRAADMWLRTCKMCSDAWRAGRLKSGLPQKGVLNISKWTLKLKHSGRTLFRTSLLLTPYGKQSLTNFVVTVPLILDCHRCFCAQVGQMCGSAVRERRQNRGKPVGGGGNAPPCRIPALGCDIPFISPEQRPLRLALLFIKRRGSSSIRQQELWGGMV